MSDGESIPGRTGVRWLFVLPGLVFAGLALLFAIRLGAGDPSRLPSTLIGRPAPATVLPPLPGLVGPDGMPVGGIGPGDARSPGRVTVVNVWASWCGPCRVEHPQLMDLARDGQVRLVGINYKDGGDNARRFLGTFGNPFSAVGIDPDGRAGVEWGVYGVPETFVIAPDGTVRHKHVGPLTPDAMPAFLDQVRKASSRP